MHFQDLAKCLEYDKLLELRFEQILKDKIKELSLYTEKLKVLNPLSIMEKGFSIVYRDDEIIKSSKNLNKDDVVTIRFIDGSKKATIMEE